MGTSASSSGPGSGVPLVPPWVDDPPETTPTGDSEQAEPNADQDPATPNRAPELAPAGRFRGTRLNLGRFGSSGSGESLRRGLGHYVRSGLGGSTRAAQRFGGTARKSGSVVGVLQALRSGAPTPIDLGIDPARLAGRPALETADRIAQAVSPPDGTQDSEASREALTVALRELIAKEPNVDLTALTEQQIELVMEAFIAEDICRRIELDVGKAIFDKAPSAAAAGSRFKQMNRYVRQHVAASLRRLRDSSKSLAVNTARKLASRAIRDTLQVFEEYVS